MGTNGRTLVGVVSTDLIKDSTAEVGSTAVGLVAFREEEEEAVGAQEAHMTKKLSASCGKRSGTWKT